VKARLGIDYESLRKVNPRMVYGSNRGENAAARLRRRLAIDLQTAILVALRSKRRMVVGERDGRCAQ
jgi:crotonobetainyl-CoA:carnitine CoA-transferase CaiB-like acyl-CoA transferase